MCAIKATRSHKYDDYEPDESNVTYDMVRLTNIHSCDNQEIGYISRYNTKQFRFNRVEYCSEFCHDYYDELESDILNYKDWKIEYVG